MLVSHLFYKPPAKQIAIFVKEYCTKTNVLNIRNSLPRLDRVTMKSCGLLLCGGVKFW